MLQGPGGDRWQPPEVVNNNEVLVRPEPAEEDGQPDLQEEAVETQLAPAVVKTEHTAALAEEESRPGERYAPAVQQLLQLLASTRVGITACATAAVNTCNTVAPAKSESMAAMSSTLCHAK